jgi:glycosyltransferase involved in cell wall biosynthesis
MRILHILNHVAEVGNGIVNAAVDLACLQARAGHEVGVASAGGQYEGLLARYGVRHFDLDQTRKPVNLLKASRRYRAVVRDFQPDIVHAHMMTGAVIAKSLRWRGKYRLVTMVQTSFRRSAILMSLGDRVIMVNEADARSMKWRSVASTKIRVVRNGTLGSPRVRPVSDCQPAALEGKAIVTVAGMYRRKGIAELITAFEGVVSRFPEAHLYLVGDGPDRPEFEDLARRSAASRRVHFEGFQKEPQRYMLAAEVFVLASHRDPYPLVLSEAREAGCAIVASAVDGIPEALDSGNAGLLVPPKDVPSLEAALVDLLANPEENARWQRLALQNLEAHTVDRVAQDVEAVYRELFPASGRRRGASIENAS